MNYNKGAYNQKLNYRGIFFGNYNNGSYRAFSPYKQVNLSLLKSADVDLFVDRGDEYLEIITIKDAAGTPVNLSGCTYSGSMSRYFEGATTPITVQPVDAKTGKIALSMPASRTDTLIHPRYVYTINIQMDGIITKVLHGQILITNR